MTELETRLLVALETLGAQYKADNELLSKQVTDLQKQLIQSQKEQSNEVDHLTRQVSLLQRQLVDLTSQLQAQSQSTSQQVNSLTQQLRPLAVTLNNLTRQFQELSES